MSDEPNRLAADILIAIIRSSKIESAYLQMPKKSEEIAEQLMQIYDAIYQHLQEKTKSQK
ncbi:MAG: hypothetical protein ACU4EQ_07190 [Candidatus Nitrosoglobus sp.]